MMGKIQDQIQAAIDYKEEPDDMVTITIEDNHKAVIDIVAYILIEWHGIECSVTTESFGNERIRYTISIRSTQT